LLWIFTLLPLTAAAEPAAPSPQKCQALTPYKAVYRVEDDDGDKAGTVVRELLPAASMPGDTWTLSIRSKARKLFFVDKREEVSTFSVKDGTLRPLRYRYHVDNSFSEKLTEETYDWMSGFVSGHRDKDRIWRFAVRPGLTDPLSSQWLLRHHLATADIKPETLDIPVSHKGSIVQRTYQILGETPCPDSISKGQSCIKVERVNDTRTTRFWMASSLCYLPVVIEQYKDGELQATARLASWQALSDTGSQDTIRSGGA
jgi:hypothetical protein